MTDHAIQFRAPMIRALLDGRKTQTRRLAWRVIEGNDLMKPPGSPLSGKGFRGDDLISADIDGTFGFRATKWQNVQPGDRLWVTETFNNSPIQWHSGPTSLTYRADQDDESLKIFNRHDLKWKSPRFMRRIWSRLTLIITAVRIERLQKISHDDAIAEGIEINPIRTRIRAWLDYSEQSSVAGFTDPRLSYRTLWISINGPESWDANPEVVVISFDVVKENIDGQ